MKACTKCGVLQPTTSKYFSSFKQGKMGLHPWCRQCLRTYHRQRRITTGSVKKPHVPPEAVDGVLMRLCTTCEEWKPADADHFSPQAGCKMGLRPTCRECMRQRSREYAFNHRNEAVARAVEWNEKNPEKHHLHLRAVKLNRRLAPGEIRATDIHEKLNEQDEKCYYCAVALEGTYEVDHYIPLSRGGSNGGSNIVIACRPCNRMKGSKMPDVFIAQLKRLKG